MIQRMKRSYRDILGNRKIVFSTLFMFLLIVTVVCYIAKGAEKKRYVFLYPGSDTGLLTAERRYLRKRSSSEGNVRAFVDDLLLGPVSIDLLRFIPKNTQVLSLMLRDRVLYLNLSTNVVLEEAEASWDTGMKVQGLANNLYYNFPRLRDVKVFINGQIPRIGDTLLDNLAYSRTLVR